MITLKTDRTKLAASNLGTLVVGNINSITAGFEFSSEWAQLSKIAVFSNGSTKVSVALSGNQCAIPYEVLSSAGEVSVSLRGIGNGGNYVLCTEEASLGRVSASNASSNAALAGTATASVIDTLVTDVAELKSSGGTGTGANGKSAYELAVQNGYSGTLAQWLESLKGANGADGEDGADGCTPVKGTDYFTAADIAEIVDEVLDALPVYSGGVE